MDNFKDNETDIQHLIISSLEGTASEEELLVLQKWLEESEQHFLLFHAYRQDWIQAGCVQRYQTGEAWKKVERRLFHRMPVKHLFLWTPDSRICCFGGIDDCCRLCFYAS